MALAVNTSVTWADWFSQQQHPATFLQQQQWFWCRCQIHNTAAGFEDTMQSNDFQQ